MVTPKTWRIARACCRPTPSIVMAAGSTALIAACSSPTGPSNNFNPDFIVTTGINVIGTGGSTQLTATGYKRSSDANAYVYGVQQSMDRTSSVTWSSANPAVAVIRGATILGVTPGVTDVTANDQGHQYVLPVYVVTPSSQADQFVGSWSGVGTFSCKDLIGDTRSCYNIPAQPNVRMIAVSLQLANVGGVLKGSIDIGGGSFSHLVGPVVAGVTDRGELLIGGTPGLPDHNYGQQLRDWRFTAQAGQLVGSGTSDVAFVNIYGPVLQHITYTEITLR